MLWLNGNVHHTALKLALGLGNVSNNRKPRSWLRCSMHTRCSVSNAGAAELEALMGFTETGTDARTLLCRVAAKPVGK